MNHQFNTQDFFAVAKEARIPENVQAFAEENVAKTREAYTKLNTVAKENVRVLEDVLVAAHAGAKSIGEKVARNVETNTEAAFAAARSLARADTLPEVVRLQTNFVQQQLAVAGAQTKELFELSAKVAQQTFQMLNSAATKSFEQLKQTS